MPSAAPKRSTGHELLGILSSRPACRNIPVIILTTSRNPDDRLRITEKQVIGYLTKPHDLLSFNTVIRELRQKWHGRRDG